MKRRSLLALLLALPLASCTGPAAQAPRESPAPAPEETKNPAYVGRWARTIEACMLDQSHEDTPIEFHVDGYDQHETHCTFAKLVPDQAGRFESRLQCTVQGAMFPTLLLPQRCRAGCSEPNHFRCNRPRSAGERSSAQSRRCQ